MADNAWVMKSNTFATQDVDAAFMSKSDLQSKVDTLYGEINFLKYLFDTVSAVLRSPFSFPISHKGVKWRRFTSLASSLNWVIPSTSMVLVEPVEMWVEIGEGKVVPYFMLSGYLGHEGNNQVFTHCGKSTGLWENPREGNRRDFVVRTTEVEQESELPTCRLCLTWGLML